MARRSLLIWPRASVRGRPHEESLHCLGDAGLLALSRAVLASVHGARTIHRSLSETSVESGEVGDAAGCEGAGVAQRANIGATIGARMQSGDQAPDVNARSARLGRCCGLRS